MYASYPIYTPPQRYAVINGEFELWKESFNINMRCKEFITDNIYFIQNDGELRDFITNLTGNFGLERAMFVLAKSIRNAEFSDRLGEAVKERASLFVYEDEKQENRDGFKYDRSRFFAIEMFPSHLESVFTSLMEMEREQENNRGEYEYENNEELGVAV